MKVTSCYVQEMRQGKYMVYELGIWPTQYTTASDGVSDRGSDYVRWSLEKDLIIH